MVVIWIIYGFYILYTLYFFSLISLDVLLLLFGSRIQGTVKVIQIVQTQIGELDYFHYDLKVVYSFQVNQIDYTSSRLNFFENVTREKSGELDALIKNEKATKKITVYFFSFYPKFSVIYPLLFNKKKFIIFALVWLIPSIGLVIKNF